MKCILCGSNQQNIFARVESFGFPLVYYQCENCGLIFQSSEESQAADPKFYNETYRRIYQSSIMPTAKDIWVQEQRADYLIKLLLKQDIKPPKRVLDIGASTGILLKHFKTAFKSQVVGVEPGDAYRLYAKKQDLKMYSSIETLIEASLEKFDLVSMIHVLEHLTEPIEVLITLKNNLLKEHGLLLVEVPNYYAHDSYELAHIACYSPHTLTETIHQAGFEIIFLKHHGVPRSKLLNLYLTVLARPVSEGQKLITVKKERLVGLKRRFAMFYRKVIQKLFPNRAWLPLPMDRQE